MNRAGHETRLCNFDNPKTNLTYEKTYIFYISIIVPNPVQI